MSGIDFLARKSLETSGSEASILINSCRPRSTRADSWSWSNLREQFCLKNAESLFSKYQSRLQHAMLILALTINVVMGASSIALFCSLSNAPFHSIAVSVSLRATSTLLNLVLFLVSYQERWFFGHASRTAVSTLILLVALVSENATSVLDLVASRAPGPRFSSLNVLVCTVFLPFPRWWQVSVATGLVSVLELVTTGLGYRIRGTLSWSQMSADVIYYVILAVMGLYIRFLTEFTNRKAFLDRRECFESKFYLQYEKNQEERLLLSVLPRHISVQVRHSIREVIRDTGPSPAPQRPFTELFVEKHRDVSILYADIVNSVALTASLPVNELVETLNELFGRFDDCAEKNSCLRIKLLGDCYYCVSGLPTRDPLHADHCVQMALDMIHIVKSFREQNHVPVDMRIGVHSGNVLSGLLGLRKWQFDIWSRDVTVAARMEQSGRPGCVHISKATKDLLKEKYCIEPGNGNIRDEYLNKLNMETYFITPLESIKKETPLSNGDSRKCSSFGSAKQLRKKSTSNVEVLSTRRRTVLGFSLLQFHEMVRQVNDFMESAIDAMALSKKDQWFKREGIQPLLLTFYDRCVERPFLTQKDPLFKYSLPACLLACFALTALSALTKHRLNLFWIVSVVAFLVIIASCMFSWTSVIAQRIKRNTPRNSVWSKVVRGPPSHVVFRTILFVFVSAMLMFISLMGIEDCYNEAQKFDELKNTTLAEYSVPIACEHPWYFTWCAILSMVSVSVFLRIHYFIKLLINGGFVAVYASLIHFKYGVFIAPYLQDWTTMPAAIDQYWCLVITLYALHLLDRQVEYVSRLDYLWKRKLVEEQEEAKTMGLVNRTLLQNILPVHVAQYYLNKESMHLDLDLYHEEYGAVAVMFASIPNYMDFYSESLKNDEGRKCLQVLHEIICDFDKLLYEPPFLKLEKIKTIGSTYMAAAGLQPGRNSSHTSHESFGPENDGSQNALVMTKFAVAIMDSLKEMNEKRWQQFHLRIGIAVGPVLAGVVGDSKPQYDIWGDTVNIASRMESTGVIGAIQVTERVSNLLQENGKYNVQCRGQTFIKGKGWMTTYLVQPPETTRL